MLRVSEEELERAIDKKEFLIQYQPKVERSSGEEWLTREAEALLRWRHPEHGVMGPLEFLPELEAFEMMGRVSELVLHEAAQQLVTWREQGLELNSCINLAPSLLNEKDLADGYETIVQGYGLECSSFTFEVAEHDVANSDAPHLKVLQSLRKKGFRISLDDFGVAASSLSTFEQLPFDEVKIHASALNRAMTSPVCPAGARGRHGAGAQPGHFGVCGRRRRTGDLRIPEDHRMRQDAGLPDLRGGNAGYRAACVQCQVRGGRGRLTARKR